MEDQKTLTNEQRLAIIEQMINTAKGKFTDNSFHFLLWGWVAALANLGHFYFMRYTEYPHPEIVWLISIPAVIASTIHGFTHRKNATTKGYTDHLSLWVWLYYMICITTIVTFGFKLNFMITPLIMLMTGFATFIAGKIIKFKPLTYGGLLFWLASVVGFLSSYEVQALIAAGAIALGYLIPGYIIRSKYKNG